MNAMQIFVLLFKIAPTPLLRKQGLPSHRLETRTYYSRSKRYHLTDYKETFILDILSTYFQRKGFVHLLYIQKRMIIIFFPSKRNSIPYIITVERLSFCPESLNDHIYALSEYLNEITNYLFEDPLTETGDMRITIKESSLIWRMCHES